MLRGLEEAPMHANIFSPALCHVDLGAVRRNFSRLGAASAIMPVIKSDAYGHGLMPVADALAQSGAERFAVGTAAEGLALRAGGIGQEILLLLGAHGAEEWQASAGNRLTPLVGSFEALDAAAAASPVRVAVKCETGMGRLGFRRDALPLLLDKLRHMPGVTPVMVLSHLSSADMPEEDAHTHEQIARFEHMSDALRSVFPGLSRSLANSAATLALPKTRYEVCRPGLALYGGNPFAGTERENLCPDLEWAMSVSAPVLEVHSLAAGESVSYGRAFRAGRPMLVAAVGIGYATGFARALSNRAAVLVNGRRAPQVGRVCMGILMVDVTDAGPVQPGDRAWLLGGPAARGQKAVDAQELAGLLNTIPYEVLCLMGVTNRRVYA